MKADERDERLPAEQQIRDALEGVEPVTWRWRPISATRWMYDPALEWIEAQGAAIDAEPLYSEAQIRALLPTAEAQFASLTEALTELEKHGAEVASRGAVTGIHLHRLNAALANARAALQPKGAT